MDINYLLKKINKNKKTFTKISTDKFNLQNVDIPQLTKILENNNIITNLELAFCKLDDNKSIDSICNLIKKNKTITNICLWETNIDSYDVIKLMNALKENQTLEILTLWNNKIDDVGALAIAELLKINRTIRFITLGNNLITNIGANAILDIYNINDVFIGTSLWQNKTDNIFEEKFKKICLERKKILQYKY